MSCLESRLTAFTAPGKCIDLSELCDGHEDCPSGADEASSQCIALAGRDDIQQDLFMSPVPESEGYLKVRTYGVWYTYCAPVWADQYATAICAVLGYQENLQWDTQDSQQVRHGILQVHHHLTDLVFLCRPVFSRQAARTASAQSTAPLST